MSYSKINQNNKRIARNTVLLYIRMLLITLISLYTVRVTLHVLGADDYGIYNAIAGVIGFIGFISGTLTNSAQRFLAYDLGKEDTINYRQTFSMLMIVFVIIALVIVVVAEILGPWLINDYLVIPQNRLNAAHWIFQLSLLTLFVRFVSIPYSASVVANEKMGFYAYLSIAEVTLKLLIVYALVVSPIDRLIFYAFLLFLMDVIIASIYIIVCIKRFPGCRFERYWNRTRFKEIGSYIGWNTFGSVSAITETQLITVILNHFFAPVVITSKAIADKIQNVTFSLVSNFVLASSPQMVKYFSVNDDDNFSMLFYRISKVSFFLMIIISAPLFLLMPMLLKIWLGTGFLDEMVVFSRMAIIVALINSLETPISRAVFATGKIRLYESLNCLSSILGIPIVYFFLTQGAPAHWCYGVYAIITALTLIYRIIILSRNSKVNPSLYFKKVIAPAFVVLIFCIIADFCLNKIVLSSILSVLLFKGLGYIFLIGMFIFFVGFNKSERSHINNLALSWLRTIKSK